MFHHLSFWHLSFWHLSSHTLSIARALLFPLTQPAAVNVSIFGESMHELSVFLCDAMPALVFPASVLIKPSLGQHSPPSKCSCSFR